MTLLAWAQSYAERGRPVVPLWGVGERDNELRCRCGKRDCPHPGKHPCGQLVPHGLTEATSDREVITTWWSRHPFCNIGLVCGTVFDVLDVDHVDFAEGVADLPMCETDGGPVVRTGSGKWHLYFASTGTPRKIRFSTSCDWLGIGGYVAAPPSRHINGGLYEWFTPHTVALTKPPVFLTNMVAPAPRAQQLRTRRVNGPTSTSNWSPAGLIGKVAAAPEGQRNDLLFWAARCIAADVHAGKVDPTTASNALDQLAVAAERTGLGRREVDTTIRSSFRGTP